MSFRRVIATLGGGKVLADCECAMAELVAAVKATGGKGEVRLAIKVEFNEQGDSESCSVDVSGEVKTKIPKVKRKGMTLYVRPDLTLSARDPRQPEIPGMPLTEADVSLVEDRKSAAAGA